MKNQYAIAVDLGASKIRVGLVSPKGKIVQKESEPTNKQGKSGVAATRQITSLANNLLSQTSKKSVCGIGIASIGPLDYKRGGPVHSPNIPYSFIPLTQPLAKTFSLPVYLLNDTNAAVLGEQHFGAGKNVDNLVYITLSTGIGGGAIVNGNLLLGKSGNAAEVGHMIVDTEYNLLCTCKKGVGHWEGLASGTNIPRFFSAWAKKNDKTAPLLETAKDIFREAQNKNSTVLDFLEELANVNAHAISNIIVAYDPALITVGGSVALNNKGVILSGIKKYIDHYLKLPKIKITKLGEDIGLLGAAATVFHNEKGQPNGYPLIE